MRITLAVLVAMLAALAARAQAQSCEDRNINDGKHYASTGDPSPDPVKARKALTKGIGRLQGISGCQPELAVAYVYLGLAYMSLPYPRMEESRTASLDTASLENLKEEAARWAFTSAFRFDRDRAISTAAALQRNFDQPIQKLFDEVRDATETEWRLQKEALEQARQAAAAAEKRLADALRTLQQPGIEQAASGWSFHLGVATGIAILQPFHPFSARDRREGLMPFVPYISVAHKVWGPVGVGGFLGAPAAGSHLGGGIIVALAVRPIHRAPITAYIGYRVPTTSGDPPDRMAIGIGADFRFPRRRATKPS
jgi:hypothetical protein